MKKLDTNNNNISNQNATNNKLAGQTNTSETTNLPSEKDENSSMQSNLNSSSTDSPTDTTKLTLENKVTNGNSEQNGNKNTSLQTGKTENSNISDSSTESGNKNSPNSNVQTTTSPAPLDKSSSLVATINFSSCEFSVKVTDGIATVYKTSTSAIEESQMDTFQKTFPEYSLNASVTRVDMDIQLNITFTFNNGVVRSNIIQL